MWPKNPYKNDPTYIKLFGGGEVVSDARPIPYNGRNYLLLFYKTILKDRYRILGGIWTEKKWGSSLLYKQFLGRAERIVVREKASYEIAKKYTKHVELYRDFCFDLLETAFPQIQRKPNSRKQNFQVDQPTPTTDKRWLVEVEIPHKSIWSKAPAYVEASSNNSTTNNLATDNSRSTNSATQNKPQPPQKILININSYIRNETTKRKITGLKNQFPEAEFRFVPAEIGSDDSYILELQALIPSLHIYHRTNHTVQEIGEFIQSFDYWIAARLHILLLLQFFDIPFTALVYQEKIIKMLQDN